MLSPKLAAIKFWRLSPSTRTEKSKTVPKIGGGFKDTTRIASFNADMWADICMTNSDAIATHLRDLQNILGTVIAAIESHDRQAVHDYFAKSKARRDKILETITFDPN
ncbi:MAG: prephenate dehydrogenase/arogenate dehydrogenase family protein [Quinella sp. 3Q1]|nr:prephenate dehydrogenase/arogenate dehydrogenase family protein [Quinella sp. 3Q1]